MGRAAAVQTATPTIGSPKAQGHRPSDPRAPRTAEAAELQLALLYRRMRAHLREPYGYAASRIRSEAEFEACLDLAADLSLRIGELCGAAATGGSADRERIRGQILQGLIASCRAASAAGVDGSSAVPPTPPRPRPAQ